MKNYISILNEYAQKNMGKVEYKISNDEEYNFYKCECILTFINKSGNEDILYSFGEAYSSKKTAKEFAATNMIDKLIIQEEIEEKNEQKNNFENDLKTLDIDVLPIDINQLNKHYIKTLEKIHEAYQNIKKNL